MFIRQNIQTLRFFRTTPAMRCPYLPHRLETKLVTELSGPDAISQHDTLTDAGFRRSHHFVYKPLCDGCRACVPVRIRVRDFDPSRAQRRILRRNEHVHAFETQPLATGEQYALFSRYVMARHHDGDMADMDFDDYRAMVEESPVETAIVEFRDDSHQTLLAKRNQHAAAGRRLNPIRQSVSEHRIQRHRHGHVAIFRHEEGFEQES